MKKHLALILFAAIAGCRLAPAPAPETTTRPGTPELDQSAQRTPNGEKSVTGKVVRVADGDTLMIRGEDGRDRKVRLHAIDAPELHQQFGETSKRNLESLARGKIATVYFKDYDQYGRIIGRVMIGEQNVNLEQLRKGCAWHFKRYANEQRAEEREIYAEAEDAARNSRSGLWESGNPQPPWEYRKANGM